MLLIDLAQPQPIFYVQDGLKPTLLCTKQPRTSIHMYKSLQEKSYLEKIANNTFPITAAYHNRNTLHDTAKTILSSNPSIQYTVHDTVKTAVSKQVTNPKGGHALHGIALYSGEMLHVCTVH